MAITGVSPFANVSIRFLRNTTAAKPVAALPSQTLESRSQLTDSLRRIGILRDALDELGKPLYSSAASISYRSAAITTADALETGPAHAATMTGTEEINTAPTSYSPCGPDWEGGSSALATIGGVYDGAAGTGTLTVKVLKGGTIGQTRSTIQVINPDGSIQTQFNMHPYVPAGTPISLRNGLTLTLDAGTLQKGDTFTIEIDAETGTSVDPDAAFDGVRNDRPDFDPGPGVEAGWFEINGTRIDVAVDDTVNQVLARITASDAGVIATFDQATETVRLEQKTAGLDYGIELGADTSGFFAAVKLAGAEATPGLDDEIHRPLELTPRFAAVSAGAIEINGVAVDIDPAVDSLLDVLDRINGAGTGATANLDAETARITISSNSGSRALTLDDGGTGMFAAMGIATGTYEPERAGSVDGMPPATAYRTADTITDLAEALNYLFDDDETGAAGATLASLREDIHTAVDRSFRKGTNRYRTDFGLVFDFRGSGNKVLRFGRSERSKFVSALQTNSRSVGELLRGRNHRDGLVERLDAVLKGAERDIRSKLTVSSGALLDTLA